MQNPAPSVVLITGASSGIGKALAERYAAAGARLALCARSLDALDALAGELRTRYKAQVVTAPCDVTDYASCQAFIDAAVSAFGCIDVLINNAGISMRAPFAELDLSVLHRLMDTNFWGAVNCTKAALPYLLKTSGSIVGVSSIAGFVGLPERTGYSASKFAMHGFLESLRTELRPQGVHVLLACPGFTASNIRARALTADGSAQAQSPRDEGKMMTADAVADAIFRAVQARRRTLVLTRQGKLTVFFKKLFPAWLEGQVWKTFEKERAWEQAQR